MKRQLLYIVFLLSSLLSIGQINDRRDEKRERIKALRIAYISERLNLTPEEAQRFWPIFNAFDDKNMELHKQKKALMDKLRPENAITLSEKESGQLMLQDEQIENDIQNNRRQLVKNLQGVIPNQKIIMLRQLEIEFKQKLLDKIQDRRERRFGR